MCVMGATGVQQPISTLSFVHRTRETGAVAACAHGAKGLSPRETDAAGLRSPAAAAAYLKRERTTTIFSPRLVHEAYLRLLGQERVTWQNRAHFYGVAAQTMRRILVDHARGHRRDKRFGAAIRVALDDRLGTAQPRDCEMLLLDQALDELAAFDPRQAQIVELRYFGGLTEAETANVLAVSRSTVTREWLVAKGWLFRRVTTGQDWDLR
jgi:RNA polymerase sigma factor (TIGR02999 family)